MYAFVHQETGPLKVFKEPEIGMIYTMGIDAATGLGEDYSCAQVLTNTIPCEQVAVFRAQWPVYEFTKHVNMLGLFYNEALNVCEINYPGNSVQEALLQQYKYPRNYQSERHLDEQMDITSKYGFRMTETTKWLVINEMQVALSNEEVIIHDATTISEFMNFVYQSSKRKAGAAAGFNDDTVIAMMLAYHGAKLYPFIRRGKPTQIKNETTDVDAKKAWRLFRERLNTTGKQRAIL